MNDFSQINNFLLQLSLAPGIGARTIFKIFKKELNSSEIDLTNLEKKIDQLRSENFNYFVKNYFLSESVAKKIVQALADKTSLNVELEKIEKHRIDLISIFDLRYPKLLKKIEVPPVLLYCKGNLQILDYQKNVSIVGSRAATFYADQVLDLILPEVIGSNYVTISGGALGVDTLVHKKTLELSGKTISVLGSGLGRIYPQENEKLFEKIVAQGGLMISAFSVNAPPEKHNFPIRNRIIAGLSLKTLVVQAAKKSGALITANYALEENRDVYAVPGPVNSELSCGTNQLIKNGAQIVTLAQDLIELSSEQISSQTPQLKNLLEVEVKVIELLEKNFEFEKICQSLNLKKEELADVLFDLEMKDLVEQTFTGSWVLK